MVASCRAGEAATITLYGHSLVVKQPAPQGGHREEHRLRMDGKIITSQVKTRAASFPLRDARPEKAGLSV